MANNNDKFISRENAKTLWGYMIDLLTGKQNKLTFDNTPTQGSDNPVKSGGIFTALAGKGTYSKPQNGIPKTDLENAVQTSLGLADSALQSETDPTVPSWAKATNKPSYTQDEVGDGTTYKRVNQTEKDTWSGKQDKIDSSHKLSSTLVSFTTAEAAALASGIDSAKVSQISTNQTNILYALENGAANLLKIIRSDSSEAKIQNDGSVVFNHAAGTATYIHLFVDTEGDGYKLLPESWKGKYFSGLITNTTDFELQMEFSNNGTSWAGSINVTEANQKKQIPSSYTYYRITARLYNTTSLSNYVIKPMIADELVYDAIGVGQPPALPNYDLTRLESEDRAGLIDVVDSGAKNLLDLSSTDTSSITKSEAITITRDSANEFTITRAASPTAVQEVKIPIPTSFPTNKYVILSGCPSNGAYATYSVEVWENNAYLSNAGGDYGSGTKEFKFSTTTGRFIRIRFGNNTSFSNLKFKFMCCTKAAFGVSSKFVPYRPNWDLVAEQAANSVWSLDAKMFATSAANTWEYTGLSFTVPAYEAYELAVSDLFSNTTPKGVLIARVSTNLTTGSNIIAASPTLATGDWWTASTSAITPILTGEQTYYVWVNHSAASAQNAVRLFSRRVR